MTTTTTEQLLTTDRTKFFPTTTWNPPAKPCDYCHSAAALLFCRHDSAFMCISCDAKLHSTSNKHARVWLCDVCEHSPAAFTCKADAASLCVSCDRDIHAANPLARRHERVAVTPFFDSAESVVIKMNQELPEMKLESYVSDPWVIPDPSFGGSKYPAENPEVKSMEFLFADSDQFVEFENYGISSQPYSDSVVPVQTTTKPPLFSHDYSSENRFEIDFTKSNISSYNNSTYTAPSLSVSSSSIDVGVVPNGSAMSEISYPFMKNPVTMPNLDLPTQIGMDREARVLRYKEKRKNRKFEKTVRYASRKAYAETRPRIKGRFAKRTDGKSESDERNFGSESVNYERYGVVPSF